MTCPILSHLPVRSHVCTRSALCGSHASRIVWPAFTPACTPALALALAPAHERPARLPTNLPTTNPQFNRPISGDLPRPSRSGGPGRAAGLRIWHPARPRLGAACVRSDCRLPIPGRPRACLPRLPGSLQPFPPVSPERGGASCLPRPAIRLSFWQPRDSFAKPRGSPTRDPARAGATVGRFHLDVRACQVWGLGVQHRRRSSNDCPPSSLEIWGWDRVSVFF